MLVRAPALGHIHSSISKFLESGRSRYQGLFDDRQGAATRPFEGRAGHHLVRAFRRSARLADAPTEFFQRRCGALRSTRHEVEVNPKDLHLDTFLSGGGRSER